MKLKGISIFEQHIEKGVLALFILVAAGLFVMQFLTPNTIEIQGGAALPPERLEDEINQRAQSVLGRLEGPFAPADAPPEIAPSRSAADDRASWDALASATRGVYDDSVDVRDTIIRPDDGGDAPDVTAPKYAEFTPPAPAQAVAVAEAGTVDPFVPASFPAAASLLPAEQPYDARYVSIQSSFDAAALFAALSTAPEDEDLFAIPSSWWQGIVELVDVRVERERRLEDGTWGERTTLDEMPGREGLRELLSDEDLTPARLVEVLDAEAERRANIRRPAMYPLIAGPDWVRPVAYRELHGLDTVDVEQGEDEIDQERATIERRIRNLHNDIRGFERSIERIRERLGEVGGAGPGGRPPARGGGARGAWFDPEPQLPGWPEIPQDWLAQRSNAGGGDDDDNDIEAEQRQRERFQRQIENLEQRIETTQARLDALCEEYAEEFDGDCTEFLGLDTDEDQGFEEQQPAVEPLVEPLEPLQAMEGPVTLWAHDLTAQPGETYRYRMSGRFINPFFAHQDALGEEQKALAEEPTISSEPGAWSAPVTVFPETYIRVLQASAASRPSGAGALGARARPARADVEVFRFFYGYWRAAEVNLLPGDQVVAAIELPDLPSFEIEPGEDGAAPTLGEQTEMDDELEFASELFMSGVFEFRSGGSTITDVLFSTMNGRTLIASQTSDQLAEAIDRSVEAAADAQVRQPGTGNVNTQPGGRTNPGSGRPPGRDPGTRPPQPTRGDPRGNPRGTPSGPVMIPD